MTDEVVIGMDDTINTPEIPLTVDGCPIFDKTPAITTQAGVCPLTIPWKLTAGGKPVRLAVPADSVSVDLNAGFEVVIRDRVCDTANYENESYGLITDPETGEVSLVLPCSMLSTPGLSLLDVALRTRAEPKKIKLVNNILLSVEPSSFQSDPSSPFGPPTLNEIRTLLRDTVSENSLLEAVEFSAADVYQAILQPVRQWNEMAPQLRRYTYTCRNFPFRMHWAKAAAGMLMRAAAHHYVRNKMQAQAPGFSSDEKNKDRAYLEMSQLYTAEWIDFVKVKKAELNARQFKGRTNSAYSYRGYMNGTNWDVPLR